MVVIGVSLILGRSFPGRPKASITEEEINELQTIDLSNESIDQIDNLEVFDNVRNLILRGNNITILENLAFLSKLEYIDLSENKIQSIESLSKF